jgi:hypothetical protein
MPAPFNPPTQNLTPPTPGTCSSCFFGQTFNKADPPARLCRYDTPQTEPWPTVTDSDWCGHGCDATSFGRFAPSWF